MAIEWENDVAVIGDIKAMIYPEKAGFRWMVMVPSKLSKHVATSGLAIKGVVEVEAIFPSPELNMNAAKIAAQAACEAAASAVQTWLIANPLPVSG